MIALDIGVTSVNRLLMKWKIFEGRWIHATRVAFIFTRANLREPITRVLVYYRDPRGMRRGIKRIACPHLSVTL
jgi:hypothetical protein